MRFLVALIGCLFWSGLALAQPTMLGSGPPAGKRSQINISSPQNYNNSASGSNTYINYLKSVEGWKVSGVQSFPNLLDQNGNALAALVSSSPFIRWWQPQAAERPGNWVLTAAGSGELSISTNTGPSLTNVSCTGTSGGAGDCSNTTCTGMAGYISANILNVTTAPSGGASCNLVVGQPVSASSAISTATYTDSTGQVHATLSRDIGVGVGASVNVTAIGNGALGAVQQLNANGVITTAGTGGITLNYTAPTGLCGSSATALSCTGGVFSFTTGEIESTTVNRWGEPTIILGKSGSSNCPSCTGNGGTGSYLVNFSQTIGSSGDLVALTPGIRLVFGPTGVNNSTFEDNMKLVLNASTSGDRIRWIGEYHSGDEADYDAQSLTPLGTITQSNYRSFFKALNPAVARDLGASYNVINNISTWATTRSPQYIGYGGYEQRPNIYAGTATYAFSGGINKYTLDWYQNAGSAPTNGETLIFQTPASSLAGQTALTNVNFTSGSSFTCPSGSSCTYANVPITTVTGSGTGAVASIVVVISNQVHTVLFGYGNQGAGGGSGGVGYAIGDQLSLTVGGQTLSMTVSGLAWNAQLSVDNGSTFYPFLNSNGQNIWSSAFLPASTLLSITFNSGFGGWLIDGNSGNSGGLFNPGPPQAYVQICAELGIDPWFTEPTWASDPPSDYMRQVASYTHTNYPSMHLWGEPPDEEWNQSQGQFVYAESIGVAWMQQDPVNWFENVPIFNNLVDDENGKLVSLIGQDFTSVYGATGFEVTAGVQTSEGSTYAGALGHANRVVANAFVHQSFAAPAGYAKLPGYNYATYIGVTDYWLPLLSFGAVHGYGPINEEVLAYQWFYGSSAVRDAVMTTYLNSALVYLQELQPIYANWMHFATSCGGTNVVPCHIKGIDGYEGGNSVGNHGVTGSAQPADTTQPVVGAVNATQCVLNLGPLPVNSSGGTTFTGSITGTTLAPQPNSGVTQAAFGPGMILTGPGVAANTSIVGYLPDPAGANMQVTPSQTLASTSGLSVYGSGAVVGMSNLKLSSVVGGTWSSTYTGLTVVATTPTTITLGNLDCSGLGTLTSATLTYVGSANQVTTMRYESYEPYQTNVAEQIGYENFANAGGVNPSQSNEVAGGGYPWFLENFDNFGWYSEGTCDGCNLSGSTLTLGGNITGEFKVGRSLLGKGIATLGNSSANTTINGCTLGGGNVAPCGTTAGDQLALSQAAFASETGVSIGSFDLSTLASFQAIQTWNNGSFAFLGCTGVIDLSAGCALPPMLGSP